MALSIAAVPTKPVRHPLLWVPTLYFAMGTPMITVSVVAGILYKNLGLSNADIALYTGSMYLPWVIKPLWAPLVEMFGTKRSFVLATELAMAATLGAVALALALPSWLALTLAIFWVTGFASATQDVAADGVYIGSMGHKEQSLYVGVQGIAWNIGRILAAGALVSFTGKLHDGMGLGWRQAWMVVMMLLGGVMLASFVWHARVLPSGGEPRLTRSFGDAFASFFKKPGIVWMIAFTFFYRVGEGLIEKIGPLFLLDAREVGGLGLDNFTLGNVNGTFGTLGFVVGALCGGWFVARRGLRRALMFLCLALNVPHVTYLYLSQARPESLGVITAVVTIEKLGYGFGSVGQMLYMMQQLAPGRYKTAHYAFATGIMGLSMMLSGMVSGMLQEVTGYRAFFVIALCVSALPIVATWRAPFPVQDK